MISSRRSGSDALAWWLVATGAVAALVLLTHVRPEVYGRLASTIFTPVVPRPGGAPGGGSGYALSAIHYTLLFTVTAFCLSLGAGIFIGLMRSMNSLVLRLPASIYVETMRGIPLLVILLATYFGLNRPFVVGDTTIHIGPFWAATLGIVVCYAAYMGEVVRAGIESIPRELVEAAYIEGTHAQVAFHVMIPLALRRMLPAIANEFIALLKDTSLISVLGITETTMAGRNFATSSLDYFRAYFYVALVYLAVTLILSKLFRLAESAWETH